MTTPVTPATNKPSPSPKSGPTTGKTAPNSKIASDTEKSTTAPSVVETSNKDDWEGDSRIPKPLRDNISLSMCARYLEALDEITEYNKTVLVEKKPTDMTESKVIAKAKELANPDDANTPANAELKVSVDKMEAAKTEYDKLRKSLVAEASKVLGIEIPVTVERSDEVEAPLREKRKIATDIGKQLNFISQLNTDANTVEAIASFLTVNPLPSVGRDQSHTFGSEEKTTPKYRVDITVTNADGDIVLEKPSFSATALALTKFYPRGAALKSDALREKWEAAGNTPENTVKDPVEFEDNNLIFKISKRK